MGQELLPKEVLFPDQVPSPDLTLLPDQAIVLDHAFLPDQLIVAKDIGREGQADLPDLSMFPGTVCRVRGASSLG